MSQAILSLLQFLESDDNPVSQWDGRPNVNRIPGVMAEYDRLLEQLKLCFPGKWTYIRRTGVCP